MLEVLSDLRSYKKSFQSIDGGRKGRGRESCFQIVVGFLSLNKKWNSRLFSQTPSRLSSSWGLEFLSPRLMLRYFFPFRVWHSVYKSSLDNYKMFTFQEDGPTLGIDIGLPYCCDKLATRIHHRTGTPGVDFPMISRQCHLCGNAKKWNMVIEL